MHRINLRRIFPDRVLGNRCTMTTFRNEATAPMFDELV
jgi:hypothetical protein